MKRKKAFLESIDEHVHLRWLMLLGTTLLIAVLLFPGLWSTSPKYHIGDVAKKDKKSPKDFLIEDKEATQEKREEARRSALTIYDLDDTLASKTTDKVMEAFEHVRALSAAENPGKGSAGTDDVKANQTDSYHYQVWKEKLAFEDILGVEVTNRAFKALEKAKFSASVSQKVDQLLHTVFRNGIVGNKQLLMQQQHNGIIVRKLSSKQENHVVDLENCYSLDEAKTALARIGKTELDNFDYSLRNVMIDLAQRLTQPNLTLNKGETEERRNQAVADVKAVLTQIKKGEMLVREGEKVSALHMAKLHALESEMGREHILVVSAGFVLLVLSFFAISFTTNFETEPSPTLKNKDILCLCIMLVIVFGLSEVSANFVKGITRNLPYAIEASSGLYAVPVASGAMTVCLFMGAHVALTFALATAFITSFLFENQFHMFLFFLLSSMVGAYSVRNCKERDILVKAGLSVGLVNVVVITALQIFGGSGLQLKLVWDLVFGILGGIISGILTTGLAPVVEMIFGYTTDIKLLELANLERPILRKLMLEAPGTYHHSVIVGSLGEAAAATIGANPLLAKVSGYYHDVGKIKKPLYFIENQIACKNKHDKLAPSMSSLILTSHVRDGVEIAKRYRLGKAIVDIIQQHHGTSLIVYFYEKSKKLKGEDAVNVEHFRYPGPKPQTKEAGLVLLADTVEAASRTLENPTPARIKGLVQKIINDVFLDGQLDECELTLRDLNKIVESFNKILNGIHHHRIEYPHTSSGTKKADGNPDKRHTKAPQDRPQEDREERQKHSKCVRIF